MSLLSFISQPVIREGFRSAVAKPPFKVDKPMLAPPLSTNYRIIGRAFDYLMWFYVERLNPEVKATHWVAARGVLLLIVEKHKAAKLAKGYFDEARRHYQTYLQNGIVTDELLSAAIRLAYIEGVYRDGIEFFDVEKLRAIDERDVADLRALMSLPREKEFKAQKACHLNPTFGLASELVRGADADIIIDNRLIDIKTTKNLVLEPKHLHQLVGYHILLSLGGLDIGRKQRIHYAEEVCEVNELCIYFSRHGYLHSIRMADLIAPAAFPAFVKWFIEAACPAEDKRMAYCGKFHGQVAKQMFEEMRASLN